LIFFRSIISFLDSTADQSRSGQLVFLRHRGGLRTNTTQDANGELE